MSEQAAAQIIWGLNYIRRCYGAPLPPPGWYVRLPDPPESPEPDGS